MKNPYEIRENVGYVSQQYSLPTDLTVQENMEFFANVHNVPFEDQKKKIDELLEFTV
jgi:ABC-2 type transport system ATP-binding protein